MGLALIVFVAVLMLFFITQAHAEQIEKTPASFPLITYAWVVGLSIWGGIVSYVQRVRAGAAGKFSITEAIGEVVTSGFVGIMTFWLCSATGINELMTAAFVGVSGHMGARGIRLLETMLEKRFGLSTAAEVINDQRNTPQN